MYRDFTDSHAGSEPGYLMYDGYHDNAPHRHCGGVRHAGFNHYAPSGASIVDVYYDEPGCSDGDDDTLTRTSKPKHSQQSADSTYDSMAHESDTSDTLTCTRTESSSSINSHNDSIVGLRTTIVPSGIRTRSESRTRVLNSGSRARSTSRPRQMSNSTNNKVDICADL